METNEMSETLFVRFVFSATCRMKAGLGRMWKRRTVAFRHKDAAQSRTTESTLGLTAISGAHDRSDHRCKGGETIRWIDVKSRRPGDESPSSGFEVSDTGAGRNDARPDAFRSWVVCLDAETISGLAYRTAFVPISLEQMLLSFGLWAPLCPSF